MISVVYISFIFYTLNSMEFQWNCACAFLVLFVSKLAQNGQKHVMQRDAQMKPSDAC